MVLPSGFIQPCLPSKATKPPTGKLWVHELKHDGYRLMVRRDGSRVRCFTKNGQIRARSRLRGCHRQSEQVPSSFLFWPPKGNQQMQADQVFTDVTAFAVALRDLHAQRKNRVVSGRSERTPRAVLAKADRSKVLGKTGGRCHICGGTIDADFWQADHVLAHSTGGAHSVDNYLPAHSICNNYRWHYDAEEFQWILKLGVWLRTQIEKETAIGQEVGQRFCDHERQRAGRRKPVRSKE